MTMVLPKVTPFQLNSTEKVVSTNYNTYVNITNAYDKNSTDYYDDVDYGRFLLPWWQLTIFFLAFITILFVASAGNLIVIWIVLAHKRMRTVTNYFLVNLAIADFMISVLNMMMNFTFLLYQDWWFGSFFCKFSMFTAPCTISVSVLTFMAIAIDRYVAIMYPLRPRLPKRHVIAVIVGIWVISVALSLPNLIFAENIDYGGRKICMLTWSLREDTSYNYLLLVLNYVFPLLTLTVTYTRVGVELWGSRAIGEETPVQHDRVQSKRKVVKMMIVVVLIFAICWLPTHIYFLATSYDPILRDFEYIQQIYIVIFLMAMSNSMYNPIIYCWMNSRFREGFISVFCWCPCHTCKKVRTRLRFRRTLFPTGAKFNTMSEKFSDRNGSLMHTMTDYVDTESNGSRNPRIPTHNNSRIITRKHDDFV